MKQINLSDKEILMIIFSAQKYGEILTLNGHQESESYETLQSIIDKMGLAIAKKNDPI